MLLRQIKAVGNRSRTVRKYTRAELLALFFASGLEIGEERAYPGMTKLLCRSAVRPEQ